MIPISKHLYDEENKHESSSQYDYSIIKLPLSQESQRKKENKKIEIITEIISSAEKKPYGKRKAELPEPIKKTKKYSIRKEKWILERGL